MIPVKICPNLTTEHHKNFFFKEKFLTTEICEDLIHYGIQNQAKDIKFTKWNHKFNVCNLPIDHNIHNLLNNIWEEAIVFFGARINFIEQYSLKSYSFGSYFGEHTDNYICVTDKIDRKLTLIVQLSNTNDYTAGDVNVMGKILPRNIGDLIIFPSAYSHNVGRVGKGERWSLVSWAWGPAF